MEAQLHDGTILEFPDGTDPAIVQAAVKRTLAARGAAAPTPQAPVAAPAQAPAPAPTANPMIHGKFGPLPFKDYQEGGRAFGHNLAKFGHNIANTAQQIGAGLALRVAPDSKFANALASTALKDEEAAKALEAQYQKEVPNSSAAFSGALAGNLLPFLYGGGATKLSQAGTVAQTGVQKVLAGLGPTFSKYAGRVANATTQGGIAGAVSAPGLNDLGSSTATGAAFGGVFPAVIGPVVRATGKLTKPIIETIDTITSEGGKLRQAERFLRESAGSARDKVVQALHASNNTPLPGKIAPTTAQVIASANLKQGERFGTELIKLQDDLTRYGPTADKLQNVKLQQQLAAKRQIADVAGTPAQKEAIEKAASDAAKPYYDQVAQSTKKVGTADLYKLLSDAGAKNKNNSAITRAVEKLQGILVTGKSPKGNLYLESNPQNLKSMSDEIKGMIAAKKVDGTAEYDVKLLTEAKQLLDASIGKAEPAYAKARQVFSSTIEPANRLAIGQALEKKLTPPTGAEAPGSFLTALADEPKLLKNALGSPRYKKGLDEAFAGHGDELFKLNSVADDLERDLLIKQIVSKTKAGTNEGINEAGVLQLPNLLNRPTAILNAGLRKVGADVQPKVAKHVAEILANPARAEIVLRDLPAKQRAIVQALVERARNATAGQVATPSQQ